MGYVSVLWALIAPVGTVALKLSYAAAQTAAYALTQWTVLSAAIASALLLYRSTIGVARRDLLVGTVTTERATWRTDLHSSVANLVSIANAMAPSPSRKEIAAFDKVRVEVRLRLDPSLRPEDVLGQRILAALKDLHAAFFGGAEVRRCGGAEVRRCGGAEVRRCDQVDAIESEIQFLLNK